LNPPEIFTNSSSADECSAPESVRICDECMNYIRRVLKMKMLLCGKNIKTMHINNLIPGFKEQKGDMT
jgi:hypothetical protein